MAEQAEMREAVRQRYATAALSVLESGGGSCCGPSGCGSADPVTADLYEPGEAPSKGALAASLGCGNPTALIDLVPGQTVLDLGSGGGLDVLLSARRVAPGGVAYGLDMTDEMLALAERNRAEAGTENARFVKGTIEDVPLPSASASIRRGVGCAVTANAPATRKNRTCDSSIRPVDRSTRSASLPQP
ncbi:MAG: methyltransferase domain-containing protein [Nigerium sp.]|nr:methyltransferase domain-containing protein [Nigerium sp.]